MKVYIKCYEQTGEKIDFKRRNVKEIFIKAVTLSQMLIEE